MSDAHRADARRARAGPLRASVVSAACFLRGLPLFFRAAPRTPLRVFGIIALDTLHVLRTSRLLPRQRISDLALLLDFQGCVNAAWDRKGLCGPDYQAIRERLDASGLASYIEDYLSRLRDVEARRPSIGGDHRGFEDVQSYREAVVRLSIATPAAIALNAESLDEAIRATQCESDLQTLFLILMQCQIIDDVLDYKEDLAAGLPSFLTASTSRPQALEWTAQAARSYAAGRARASGATVFPLRIALSVFTAVATLVVRVARWRHRREWEVRTGIVPLSKVGRR